MRNQGLSKSQRERNRRRAQGAESSQGADEEDTEVEQEKPAATTSRTAKSSSAASSASLSNSNAEVSAAPPEDDRVWVQCNTCDKWRSLPNTVDPAMLPDIWFCELNIYDAERNCCEVNHVESSLESNIFLAKYHMIPFYF
jgi:CW-type Zinc Finger